MTTRNIRNYPISLSNSKVVKRNLIDIGIRLHAEIVFRSLKNVISASKVVCEVCSILIFLFPVTFPFLI